jgi:hypothetical protein
MLYPEQQIKLWQQGEFILADASISKGMLPNMWGR